MRALCSVYWRTSHPHTKLFWNIGSHDNMTCNITNTPLYPEPLPVYSRHDPDAVSIRSAAPSYVSDTPTYISYRTPRSLLPPLSPNQQIRGLPAAQYAPGFEPRAHGSTLELNHHFNISWSAARTGANSRQYEAVARRRANQAAANTTTILNSLSAVPSSVPTANVSNAHSNSPNVSSTNVSSYPVQVTGSSSDPVNPLEDPYLVGEEAATRARAARVYREMCLQGRETARVENRSWDFMWTQMSDWHERERSWTGLRTKNGRTKLLGRRLGFRT